MIFRLSILGTLILMAIFSTLAHSQLIQQQLNADLSEIGAQAFTASDYKPGLIRHIVLFRYKPSTSAAQMQVAMQRFMALKNTAQRNGVPYIVNIETGEQISGEGADQGYTQAFIVSFQSQGDRNYYVGKPIVSIEGAFDPAHDQFKTFVGPLLDDEHGALVFDFDAQASEI